MFVEVVWKGMWLCCWCKECTTLVMVSKSKWSFQIQFFWHSSSIWRGLHPWFVCDFHFTHYSSFLVNRQVSITILYIGELFASPSDGAHIRKEWIYFGNSFLFHTISKFGNFWSVMFGNWSGNGGDRGGGKKRHW
jgi:hypothetical protein